MKLLKKNCAFCNKPFLTYELDKFYCNDVCQTRDCDKLKAKSAKEKGVKNLTHHQLDVLWKKYRKKQCRYCGNIYYVPKKGYNNTCISSGNVNLYYYCSVPCQATSTSGINKIGTYICKNCGIEFKQRGSASEAKYSGFCTNDCKYSHERKLAVEQTEIRRKESLTKIKKKRKTISYEELNRRAEVKRLNEEWEKLV